MSHPTEPPAPLAAPAAQDTAPRPSLAGRRALVVGSGAIGSLYGALLHRAGLAVSVVCRSDLAVVRQHGLRVRSRVGTLGNLSFHPAAVLADAAEAPAPPDVLLLCVKVLDGLDRAALIRPAVGPHTTLVLIQNGLDIEADIAHAFPANEVISVLAFVGVSRSAPGEFEHQAYGHLTLGRWPRGRTPACVALAEAFRRGGVDVAESEDIVTERWRKTVWNAAFNPLSVLAGGADTQVLLGSPESEALVRALMHEVCTAAAAAGHPLPPEQADLFIESTKRMPPYRNSMALDLLNGRPVELEAILGHLLQSARCHGAAVPRLETIYTAVRLLMAQRGG